jgi:hypothetical protein
VYETLAGKRMPQNTTLGKIARALDEPFDVLIDLAVEASDASAQRNNDAASSVRDTTSSIAQAGASNNGHRGSHPSKSSKSSSVRARAASRSLAGDRRQVAEISPHKS